MAYSQEIKDAAFFLWMRGHSAERIAQDLDIKRPTTITDWKNRDKWVSKAEKFRPIIEKETEKNLEKRISDEVKGDLEILDGMRQHIRGNLAQTDSQGNVKLLGAGQLRDLSTAHNTVSKRSRIIQHGADDINLHAVKGEVNVTWQEIIYGDGREDDNDDDA